MNGTSRVNREVYARFCERLGVKFPGPTRRRSVMIVPTASIENLDRTSAGVPTLKTAAVHQNSDTSSTDRTRARLSLVSEGHHRIYSGGTPGWNERCSKRYGGEYQRYRGQCDGIKYGNSVQHSPYEL
jgi:hypothetical protein